MPSSAATPWASPTRGRCPRSSSRRPGRRAAGPAPPGPPGRRMPPGGPRRPEAAIAVPLDALADFEGRDDAPVVLEAAAPGRTSVRWDDRGIPQSREYAVPEVGPCRRSPSRRRLRGVPGRAPGRPGRGRRDDRGGLDPLRPGLHPAEGATAPRWSPPTGGRSSSRAASAFPGRATCWCGPTPLFAREELPRDRPIRVGRTDAHVVLRAGAWTLLSGHPGRRPLPPRRARRPRRPVATTRLTLDPQDAEFLGQALDRLPGGDEHSAPGDARLQRPTWPCGRGPGRGAGDRAGPGPLRLHGRAGPAEHEPPVPGPGASPRLRRGLRLGAGVARALPGRSQVVPGSRCRRRRRSSPSDDAVRIESTTPGRPPGRSRPAGGGRRERTHPKGTPRGQAARSCTRTGRSRRRHRCHRLALIQEAVALHEVLADAKVRTHRLIGALRRHRKQSRLTSDPPVAQAAAAPGGRRVGGRAGPGSGPLPLHHPRTHRRERCPRSGPTDSSAGTTASTAPRRRRGSPRPGRLIEELQHDPTDATARSSRRRAPRPLDHPTLQPPRSITMPGLTVTKSGTGRTASPPGSTRPSSGSRPGTPHCSTWSGARRTPRPFTRSGWPGPTPSWRPFWSKRRPWPGEQAQRAMLAVLRGLPPNEVPDNFSSIRYGAELPLPVEAAEAIARQVAVGGPPGSAPGRRPGRPRGREAGGREGGPARHGLAGRVVVSDQAALVAGRGATWRRADPAGTRGDGHRAGRRGLMGPHPLIPRRGIGPRPRGPPGSRASRTHHSRPGHPGPSREERTWEHETSSTVSSSGPA